ncbi:MAG TPA: sigma-54 dependent transcriptional regulator [Candidatus Acidoferrales bacterium]|nr:sigma-54 dependent transcriptional regulator [Candidatus Acidoferrales bacterium]
MTVEEFQERYGIIAASTAMKEVVATVMQVAPTDVTVLVTGESGVGKEVIARAIHGASRRAGNQLVAVNCGAIPEGILESELFGHQRGAFTGAVESRKGYFEIADGGTLFLDEIGDTPLATQVKLLRIIETGEFMRVGSSSNQKVDVRVIAASNKSLEAEVARGYFRQDLYFRLRSVNIFILPLRDRREDIPILAEKFVQEFTASQKIKFGGFSPEAIEMLSSLEWPGNVRELKNLIESIIVLERGNQVNAAALDKHLPKSGASYSAEVASRFLPVHVGKTPEESDRELILRALWEIKNDIVDLRNSIESNALEKKLALPVPRYESGESEDGRELNIEEMEKSLIQKALRKFYGNKQLAANALGISMRSLYRKVQQYKLKDV